MMEYSPDHDSQRQKHDELICVANDTLGDTVLAVRVVDALCRLSPPMNPPVVIEMMTVHSMGARGGRSRKPGNLLINMRALASEFGDAGLAAATGAVDHRLIPLAALSIWNKLWAHAKVDLTAEQASLVYAMWLQREDGNLVSRNDAYEMCKIVYANNGLPKPSFAAFENAINCLIEIRCIEWHKSGKIWLREWVRCTY